jgi:colanic acid/amylovoran biosynthesis glycosyltransferase
MNTYPVTSGTFIRREIHALEALGHAVERYAIRPWSDTLIDPQDIAEQKQTRYLLVGRKTQLLADMFWQLTRHPQGVIAALLAWARLLNTARTGFVRHCAYFLEAASLARALQNDGIQHLHAHFSTNTAAVALLAHRMGGPAYSFTVHGPDELIDWGTAALRFKVEEAAFVAAISHFCRVQVALAAGYRHWDKIRIVRCGIDPDEFAVSDAPFGPEAPFVCVGRLCPQKAQLLIVEAFAKVVADHPEARLELVGDGESRAEIEAMIAARGLRDNVALLGWRTNSEVRAILGQARALLLPSFAEGLPVVIMESLALGRPVISSFIAGIPELVDDQVGWIVPAGSVTDIEAAIRSALQTNAADLRALGLTGRARVTDRHDIHKTAAGLADLIQKAVAVT